MNLFVNDLSLQGQYNSIGAFVGALKEVMSCRSAAEQYRHPFYCVRSLATREALPGINLREAVRQTKDVNLSRIVMSWIDRHGPFWDDSRAHGPDDYMEHAGDIVTDCGLGEAAFHLANDQASAMVSFKDSLFCSTPLRVVWRRTDSINHDLDVPNFWGRVQLERYLSEQGAAPQTWAELVEQARARHPNITFVDGILEPLIGEPFSTTIADRVLVLISILDRLKSCFESDGRLNAEGHQILKDYFHGDRALFTDESETNKRTFARQLTFRMPTGEELFCPYHGKISFRYYRVHHSWPIRPDKPLYIAYIGPKITKG